MDKKSSIIGTIIGAVVGGAATFGGILLKNTLDAKKASATTGVPEMVNPDVPSENNSEES